MDTMELVGLLNSVSTRTLFIVDYCKSGQTLQGGTLTVDLATGRFHVKDELLSGECCLGEDAIQSLLLWCGKNDYDSGDWVFVPFFCNTLIHSRYLHSLRLVQTSQRDRYIAIIDDCPISPNNDLSFCVEYSSLQEQYTFSHGQKVDKFSKPKLTHDEKYCLAAFAHGLGVEATANMMNCSSSKIKQLRLSIRDKFNVGKLVEVLPLNELITFINLLDA
ncbi:MAG: helix-turn-helix transcriptional regulator [Candidatus Cryptobacteroides sp.]